MARRHESLIPLSRQHHHALALALVLRRRDGLEAGREAAWLEGAARRAKHAYDAELSGHFDVEETLLFPDMEKYLGEVPLVAELRAEHVRLREMVIALDTRPAGTLVDDFAATLDAHVHKEERRLFVEFEKRMPAGEALRLGREIDARLLRLCPGI